MQNKFSKYLTGFWKNHNTQKSLLRMIESWKVTLNNGSKVGVIIMDLSKAVSHDFTILSKWFYNNVMVLNPDKCSFMLVGVDDELQIGTSVTRSKAVF